MLRIQNTDLFLSNNSFCEYKQHVLQYKLKHIFLIHSHIATYSHIFFRLLPVFSDKKDSRKFLLMFNVILQQPFYFFNSFLVVVGTHFTLTSALCLLNIILLTFTLVINRRALLVLAGLFFVHLRVLSATH